MMEYRPYKLRMLFHEGRNGEGVAFSVKLTESGRKISFWHVTREHTYFYIFVVTDVYNQYTKWDRKACNRLARELSADEPQLEILCAAVDGVWQNGAGEMPSFGVPKRPEKKEWRDNVLAMKRARKKLIAFEKYESAKPAPFVLFGTLNSTKEYAWKLTPDKKCRQDIVPGDKVVVWTRHGYTVATVTRIVPIEEAGFKPTSRVRRKLWEEGEPDAPLLTKENAQEHCMTTNAGDVKRNFILEEEIRVLIESLKTTGRTPGSDGEKRIDDPDAKISVWYVIAKLEEALLKDEKA